MMDQQFIKKPMGFHKQRLDAFVRSVKTNKEDVQRKALDEALQEHTILAAQDMLGRALQLPPFEDLQQLHAQQLMGGVPKAAYGMELGARMESLPGPFMYPSQMDLTPANSEVFKKESDKYEGVGLNSLKGLFNTTANTILNPAISAYNKQVYASRYGVGNNTQTQQTPQTQKKGGSANSLPKAQMMGTTGSTFGTTANTTSSSAYKPREVVEAETNLQNTLGNYNSDQPVYDAQGNLLTKEQLQQATEDAYNTYYQSVAKAYNDNPTPSFGPSADFSYLNNYPSRDGLNLPNVSVSGPGFAPELLTGTAAPQTYTNLGIDRPSPGAYMGLSPYRYMTIPDMEYSQNYKEMYKDATSKGQYDRFLTEFEADPTAAGRFLDKIGIGKMFDTRNYNINQTILPEGQSIFDADRMEANRNRAIRAQNADMPGGGLFQTDEMNPYIWENRSRRDRRDVLESAGIDPNRKNLRRLGKDYFENLDKQRVREETEAARASYDNQIAEEEANTKKIASAGMIGTRPRNPYDLMGTGVQTSTPVTAPATGANPTVTQSTNTAPPPVNTASASQPFYNTNYDWNTVEKENLPFINQIAQYEITKGSPLGSGLLEYTPLTQHPEQFYNWKNIDYSGRDQNRAKIKGFDVNALPADIRPAVMDQLFNQSIDPRLTLMLSQGIINDADRYNYNADQLTALFNDPNTQKAFSEAYGKDNKAFINKYLDERLKAYGRTNKKGFDQTKFNAMSQAEKDAYLDSLEKADAYGYTWEPRIQQYRKQDGGTMLPMFQVDGEYPGYGVLKDIYDPNFGVGVYALPSADPNKTYPGINWNTQNPLNRKINPINMNPNKKTQGLGLPDVNVFPDANRMQTFFDNGNAPLTADAFGKQLDQYVPKYTGKEPQQEATASGKGKIRSSISPAGYLNIANATGKYLADGVFSSDERNNAYKQFKASRFLENNLALTSPDTQFSPRLRGFDRTTDAFAGAPFAGANVQYGQPLIPQYAQKGAELFMTMQQGGVYTLTPEMIKQIIENGGEVEYVDNNYNFDNPYNQ